MDITDNSDAVTLVALGCSFAVIGLSMLMLRLRKRRRNMGWVPWNGLLFVAIVIAAVALAHLFGIERR